MTVQIAAIGASVADDDNTPIPDQTAQQAAAKAAYEKAAADWDKVIPANPNAPLGPLPARSYDSSLVPSTDHVPGFRGPCGFFCRNKRTLLIVGGVVVVGGAAVWMLAKAASGFKRRPAVAGIGDAAKPVSVHRAAIKAMRQYRAKMKRYGLPKREIAKVSEQIRYEERQLAWHRKHRR